MIQRPELFKCVADFYCLQSPTSCSVLPSKVSHIFAACCRLVLPITMVAIGSASAVPLSVFTLDREGDLRLEVGEGAAKKTFVVCSRSVARASKPFHIMFYGPYKESKDRQMDTNWTVSLPEDDPEAFATIMHIVHGDFTKVPATVSRDQLYQITVLTDKYNMTDVLRPWADAWISPLCTRPPVCLGDEVLIWIAWELGHKELFTKTVTFLMNRCSIDQFGHFRHADGPSLHDNLLVTSLGVLGKSRCLLLFCLSLPIRLVKTIWWPVGHESVLMSR